MLPTVKLGLNEKSRLLHAEAFEMHPWSSLDRSEYITCMNLTSSPWGHYIIIARTGFSGPSRGISPKRCPEYTIDLRDRENTISII